MRITIVLLVVPVLHREKKKCFWMTFSRCHVLLYIQSINEVTKEVLLTREVMWPPVHLCWNNVLRASVVACWKYFAFVFFFTLALYIVNLQAFIYFERQFFKPNASAAASFSKGTKQVHRDSLLHNPLLYLVGCSAWNLWSSWLGTIGLFQFGTPADTLQLGLGRAVCVYRYTSKWKLWSF